MQATEEKQARITLPRHVVRPPRLRWERLVPLLTRLFVWGLIFGVLTLLGSFFTLIFLTFVFAYLQSSIVDGMARYAPRRRTSLVILTGSLFLTIVIAMSVFLAPKVYQQATGFAKGFSSYMERIDTEVLNLAEHYPMLQEAIPQLRKPVQATPPDWAVVGTAPPDAALPQRAFRDSPTGLLLGMLTGKGESTDVRDTLKVVIDQLANVSREAIGMLTTFLLALLFSFLIVLDLPNLVASVRELENTRLRFIYVEAADNIYQFGKVLGHAMQAQFYIACINTLLTGVGLYLLGMGEQVAFLSVIVFLCSFVPVAGVFISSIPISLIALNTGGLNLVLLCIGVITVTHLIEGYALNPLIYGARLRINPVIVLIILTIGGKLFHIWGLILGVPVCTYIFGHAIRYTSPGNRLFTR